VYNQHIYCEKYKELKDEIVAILNNDIDADAGYLEELENEIQELYDNEEMTSTQYDDLMSYLQDLK
jgi:hypothetical protein